MAHFSNPSSALQYSSAFSSPARAGTTHVTGPPMAWSALSTQRIHSCLSTAPLLFRHYCSGCCYYRTRTVDNDNNCGDPAASANGTLLSVPVFDLPPRSATTSKGLLGRSSSKIAAARPFSPFSFTPTDYFLSKMLNQSPLRSSGGHNAADRSLVLAGNAALPVWLVLAASGVAHVSAARCLPGMLLIIVLNTTPNDVSTEICRAQAPIRVGYAANQ